MAASDHAAPGHRGPDHAGLQHAASEHAASDSPGPGHQPLTPDWTALREAARAAMASAYAPYSKFPVGAAALVDDGRIVSGCNVENASYGLTLCAECGLVSALHLSGGGRLVAFACVDGAGTVLIPCGRCRQLLYEFGGPTLLLDTAKGILTLADLLPQAFGPEYLDRE